MGYWRRHGPAYLVEDSVKWLRWGLGFLLALLLGWSLFVDHVRQGSPFTAAQAANVAVAMTLVASLVGLLPLGPLTPLRPPELRFGRLAVQGKTLADTRLELELSAVNRGKDAWWIEDVRVLSREALTIARGTGARRLAADRSVELRLPLRLPELSRTRASPDGGEVLFDSVPLQPEDVLYGARRVRMKLVHGSGRVYEVAVDSYSIDSDDPGLALVAGYYRNRGIVEFDGNTLARRRARKAWVPDMVEPGQLVDVGDRSPAAVTASWRSRGSKQGER